MDELMKLKKDSMSFKWHGDGKPKPFKHGIVYKKQEIPESMLDEFESVKTSIKLKQEPETIPESKPADDGVVSTEELED